MNSLHQYRELGDEQLENVTNFYLDHRQFMTSQEMAVFEKVINSKRVNAKESYLLKRLYEDLKDLK
jgi:hypothetical protein